MKKWDIMKLIYTFLITGLLKILCIIICNLLNYNSITNFGFLSGELQAIDSGFTWSFLSWSKFACKPFNEIFISHRIKQLEFYMYQLRYTGECFNSLLCRAGQFCDILSHCEAAHFYTKCLFEGCMKFQLFTLSDVFLQLYMFYISLFYNRFYRT